jgi:YHS domain-containing protein
MNYCDLYNHLKQIYNYNDPIIEVDNHIEIRNFEFKSENYKMLTGEDHYFCSEHHLSFQDEKNNWVQTLLSRPTTDVADSKVTENRQFRYSVFTPKGAVKTDQVIMMFHGLNEKYWHKYLTWAYRLSLLTGKAVVLFPIAFHMNRAPHDWSDSRKMYALSEKRKQLFPDIIDSTLTNVAISSRLQIRPQRYLWSGLQTYHDVIDFLSSIRNGNHPFITNNATFDIFAYSIGSFLSQILMMANSNKLFETSRLFIFCGGATFNRYSPVTKFILDSEANVELYSYAIEHLDSHLNNMLTKICI